MEKGTQAPGADKKKLKFEACVFALAKIESDGKAVDKPALAMAAEKYRGEIMAAIGFLGPDASRRDILRDIVPLGTNLDNL